MRSVVAAVLVAIGVGTVQVIASSLAGASKSNAIAHVCTTEELKVKLQSGMAPLGRRVYLFGLMNISTTDCTLMGYPRLKLLGANGKPIAAHNSHVRLPGTRPIFEKLITVAPRWSALFTVTYATWIDYSPKTCPSSDQAEIFLPNGSQPITVRWHMDPYGGPSITKLRCGVVHVSPVFGPYFLTKANGGSG
ncbi:MAG: DUF4232 domain-containing protein [Acidimicrobiales bacterium]